MFTIIGDALAGIVVGFVLGVLAHHIYIRYAYELTEDEKPTEKPVGAEEPKVEPKTYGRSCQNFSSVMNDKWLQKCPHLNTVVGQCSFFGKPLFVVGGKYERCAECKAKYPGNKGEGR